MQIIEPIIVLAKRKGLVAVTVERIIGLGANSVTISGPEVLMFEDGWKFYTYSAKLESHLRKMSPARQDIELATIEPLYPPPITFPSSFYLAVLDVITDMGLHPLSHRIAVKLHLVGLSSANFARKFEKLQLPAGVTDEVFKKDAQEILRVLIAIEQGDFKIGRLLRCLADEIKLS